MRNRLGLLLLVALAAGFPGCAALKMGDGTPTYGPEAWNQAPAPPQRTISNTVPTPAPTIFEEEAAKPVGLAKYFPGLQRTQAQAQATATAATTPPAAEAPKVVARYRPTWFGLRPNPELSKPPQPTAYMTDARAGLARPAAEPTMLPVALQVPSSTSASDGAVKPTNAEQPISGSNSSPAQDASKDTGTADSSASNDSNSAISEFTRTPSKPGEDDVNPLATAPGSTSPTTNVVARMPAVPPVDPQETPKVGNPEPAQASTSAAPAPKSPTDDKTMKAVTEPSNPVLPPGLPEPVVPASYTSALVSQQAVGGFKKLSDCKVFASPQSAPAPAAKPASVARPAPSAQSAPRPSSQASKAPMTKPGPNPIVPTSLTKPTPQVMPSTQSAATPAATTWQRPCLRRLIRRCCGLGEFANPPTAAPH